MGHRSTLRAREEVLDAELDCFSIPRVGREVSQSACGRRERPGAGCEDQDGLPHPRRHAQLEKDVPVRLIAQDGDQEIRPAD
jgi:hypothetical protein